MTVFAEPLNPSDPEVNAHLLALARRMAVRLGSQPEVGEDAYQQILVRVESGDARPLQSLRYFKGCLTHQIRDNQRRAGRRDRLADKVKREAASNHASSRRVTFVPTFSEPEVLMALEQQERDKAVEEIRRRFAHELDSLPPHYRDALRARIRQWLVKDGGEDEVARFERSFGVNLGDFTGTAALAEARNTPPGTIAAHANRAQRALSRCFDDLKDA